MDSCPTHWFTTCCRKYFKKWHPPTLHPASLCPGGLATSWLAPVGSLSSPQNYPCRLSHSPRLYWVPERKVQRQSMGLPGVHTKAMGVLMHGAGTVATRLWELSELWRDCGALGQSPRDKEQASHSPPVPGQPTYWGRE